MVSSDTAVALDTAINLNTVSGNRGVVLVFVDGVGVGEDDGYTNPLAALDIPAIDLICGGRPVYGATGSAAGIDALLGVAGLPQSGTGQTALLTGVNASAAIGRHFGPYANAELRDILEQGSLWLRVLASGGRAVFANAYPSRMVAEAAAGGGRLGAFARSAALAGVKLRGPDDLTAGNAIAADIVGGWWKGRGGLPSRAEDDPIAVGERLAEMAHRSTLTVFECFLTDVAGHRMDRALADRMLVRIDRMLAGLLSALDSDYSIVLVSDHGNVEDMSHARHTANPAIFGWHGPGPGQDRPIRSLTDVAPGILEQLFGSGYKNS